MMPAFPLKVVPEAWPGNGRDVWLVIPAAVVRPLFAHRDSLYATIVESLIGRAEETWRCHVRPLAFHTRSRGLFDLRTGHPAPIRASVFRRIVPERVLAVNAAFVQERSHDPANLTARAWDQPLTVCATREGELQGIAFTRPSRDAAAAPVQELLARLAGVGVEATPLPPDCRVVVAEGRGRLQSPASTGIGPVSAFRRYDAGAHLNTALLELSAAPEAASSIRDPDGLRRRLADLRAKSRVPWIFNELLCEADHRTAAVQPMSVPPEMHLSMTGRCNIECLFCSYDHSLSQPGRVSVEQMARLDPLRWARTVRLHSGNGESTANPQLAAIIRWLNERHPQLELNFSTNGILLDRKGLVETLVDGVSWINVSLNAGTRASWATAHGADHFERVCANLKTLHAAKRAKTRLTPILFGSIVLTRHSAHELPRMPALCRELGIDHLTAIPFFSFRYHREGRFGPDDAYHAIGTAYDALYEETVREAEAHRVSIELPAPSPGKSAAFGLERRCLHDFARIEGEGGWRVARLLGRFAGFPRQEHAACPALWRCAHVASTTKGHLAADETHFLYPCLGPLGAVDFSRALPFRFGGMDEFQDVWNGPIFRHLRAAQRTAGLSPVCDLCRGCDSRNPDNHPSLETLVRDFQTVVAGVPTPQPLEGKR